MHLSQNNFCSGGPQASVILGLHEDLSDLGKHCFHIYIKDLLSCVVWMFVFSRDCLMYVTFMCIGQINVMNMNDKTGNDEWAQNMFNKLQIKYDNSLSLIVTLQQVIVQGLNMYI